jgi:hypothetical protein
MEQHPIEIEFNGKTYRRNPDSADRCTPHLLLAR